MSLGLMFFISFSSKGCSPLYVIGYCLVCLPFIISQVEHQIPQMFVSQFSVNPSLHLLKASFQLR